MFEAMTKITDAMCGEEPGAFEKSPAAEQRRGNRRAMMDMLHHLVALSMREGVARTFNPAKTELGAAIQRGEFNG
jgi:hypothetical protein